MIPPGDATNINGEPIDVLANIRAKREIFSVLMPGLMNLTDEVRESLLLGGELGDNEREFLDEAQKNMRQIAGIFRIDLDAEEE